jgi:large subunit ribosomal protein L10
MLKTRKAEVVAELEEQLKDSSALIVAHYRGLSVGQLAGVRRDLTGLDATLRVTKNTLAKRAAEEAGIDGLDGLLDGPTAIAFCRGDAAAVAKRLSDVARETRMLALRGAVLDGRALDEDGVKRLATLPPKETLQATVVGTIAAPLTGLVSLLAAAPRELVVVIDQIIKKKQEQEAA